MDLDRLFYPPITRERFEACRTDGRPRRICFPATHPNEPKRSSAAGYVGTLNVPFQDTIGKLIAQDCRVDLYPNKRYPGTYWCYFDDEEGFLKISEWIGRQGGRVFIRDCLSLSVALGLNIIQGPNGLDGHTRLGALEARAKVAFDASAVEELTTAFVAAIQDLPEYRDATHIAAVPPRPGKNYDLPSLLAREIASALSLTDLTPRFQSTQAKGTVKEAGSRTSGWRGSGAD